MDFSAGPLIVGFLVSSLGFVLFSYGRKMQEVPQVLAGLVLMVSPYFLPGVAWMLVAAVVTVGALWLARQYGL